MLWKIRDTEEYDNHIRRFDSFMGTYVALVNDNDISGDQVWGGHNSHGFGIMNSASFNVNTGYHGDLKDQEGYIMKRALEECQTLADFEALLDNLPKPMGLASHFGVIDADGGAAFYEVNNETWTKFDANEDTRGYILRTNYSETGVENKGYGYVRMQCASKLFSELFSGELTISLLGSDMSRSMYHGLMGVDYRELAVSDMLPGVSGFLDTDDLLTRYSTSSMILIEGVQWHEDPELTTTWVQIGNPYLTPIIPVWTDREVPSELQKGYGRATLASNAKKLKKYLYPLRTIEEERYLYMPLIYRPDGNGLAQKLAEIEAEYIEKIDESTSLSTRHRLQRELIEKGMQLQEQALQEAEWRDEMR